MEEVQNCNTQESIMEVKRKDLWDIEKVDIDKEKPVEDKLEEFSSNIKGDLTTHLNEDYVVRVHFSQENYTATDAFKHYLQQIAELKY